MKVKLLAALAISALMAFACSNESSDGSGPGVGSGAANCLERPGELSRPPAGRLPCELIPPGLSL